MHDLLQSQAPMLSDLLPTRLSDALKDIATTVNYRHDQIVHHRGDDKPGLSIVHSGRVKVGNFGSDGSYVSTSTLSAGDCFGEHTLFAGLPRTHSIVALGDCAIDQIPGRAFMRLFNAEPALAHALLTISLVRSHALLEFMDDLRRLPLPVRVAKVLLNAAAHNRDLHTRQEDLAYTFGVSRVSMGKILKQLEEDGFVQRGYGKVSLVDVDRLAEWVAKRQVVPPLSPR